MFKAVFETLCSIFPTGFVVVLLGLVAIVLILLIIKIVSAIWDALPFV